LVVLTFIRPSHMPTNQITQINQRMGSWLIRESQMLFDLMDCTNRSHVPTVTRTLPKCVRNAQMSTNTMGCASEHTIHFEQNPENW